MKSMQKLDRRDPIAEFVAEELTSAAALAHDAEITRANRRQMLESIRSMIGDFDYENIEAQIMGESPVWTQEEIFLNVLYTLRRNFCEYWKEVLA